MADSNTKSVYFAEYFSPLLRDAEGTIIALTPQACYQLDNEKIPYRTYEDFYDMLERKRCADKYHEKIFFWMEDLDAYLKTKLTEPLDKKINFVRLYGYYITTMIESFIVGSKNILAVLNHEKPAKAYLLSSHSSKHEFDWTLFTDKADLTSYLISGICKKLKIDYELIFVEIKGKGSRTPFNFCKFRRLPSRIFNLLSRIIEDIYIMLLDSLASLKRKRLKEKGKLKKILILRQGWLGTLHQEAINAGYQVLRDIINDTHGRILLNKGKINEIDCFSVGDDIKNLWKEIGQRCIQEFDPAGWVSNDAGIDIADILNPRFLYFFQKVCPVISASAKQYKRLFAEHDINYVVCPYKICPSDFGAMAVATLLPKVLSVHVEHGGGEMETPLQHFTELPANIYITSSREEADFYQKYFDYGNKDKVIVVPGRGWIDRYHKERNKILPKFSHSAMSKNLRNFPIKVCYPLAAISPQRLGSAYSLCWYYHLQKALYRHFADLSGYQFILKILYSRTWFFDSLLKFLKDLRAPNISYRDDDLVKNLRRADKVITDYPSSPTYEARLMGLPVLSLYHESISVRQTAKGIYGNSLVSFASAEDMISHIDKFLFSDPSEYILPMNDNFTALKPVEILEDIERQQGARPMGNFVNREYVKSN